MSPARIQTIIDTSPFETFSVFTGDGSRVDVLAKEFVWLYPGGRTMLVFSPRKQNAKRESDFEEHRIDVFLITKVVTPAVNEGQKRRRKAS